VHLKQYKANNDVAYSNKYHVVWCPKYRRKVLEGKIAVRLQHILVECCAYYRAEIMALEILPDPVHLRVEVDPQLGIHQLSKNLKDYSSHCLRKEFPRLKSRLPTNSDFVSTVGGARPPVIQAYVENPKNV
jgi:putative transposase